MQQAMLEEAIGVLPGADAILYLHAAPEGAAPPLATLLPDRRLPAVPILNLLTKADLLPATAPPPPPRSLRVSAVTRQGIDLLLAWCTAHAPLGPFRWAEDDLSTQPTRFFVAEFVREAAFAHLGEELPYSLAAEVDEFREGSSPLYIRVILFTERESQKGIVVGRGGRTIKQIGSQARRRIETLLGEPVYLDLWVKTLPKWRSDPSTLRRFGFHFPPETAP
jgi:GTP-binding protein Era